MLFAGRRAGPRHEIEQFTDPLLRQKPRDEDRRVGKVELLRGERFVERPGTEVTAADMVQQRRENAWRVEARTAEPIEGAARCDQRRGLQITDETVVGDQWVFVHLGDLFLGCRIDEHGMDAVERKLAKKN
jgi:hypothetical protein